MIRCHLVEWIGLALSVALNSGSLNVPQAARHLLCFLAAVIMAVSFLTFSPTPLLMNSDPYSRVTMTSRKTSVFISVSTIALPHSPLPQPAYKTLTHTVVALGFGKHPL
jgi:hypothetical protein